MRREKSLRIDVHIANAVVWEPVYRTRLRSHTPSHSRFNGRILNGSSSCTASSSMPKKKIATSVADGIIATWFHEDANGSHSASGSSSSQNDRNRAVCLRVIARTSERNVGVAFRGASEAELKGVEARVSGLKPARDPPGRRDAP
jgi:hypothetical protein